MSSTCSTKLKMTQDPDLIDYMYSNMPDGTWAWLCDDIRYCTFVWNYACLSKHKSLNRKTQYIKPGFTYLVMCTLMERKELVRNGSVLWRKNSQMHMFSVLPFKLCRQSKTLCLSQYKILEDLSFLYPIYPHLCWRISRIISHLHSNLSLFRKEKN